MCSWRAFLLVVPFNMDGFPHGDRILAQHYLSWLFCKCQCWCFRHNGDDVHVYGREWKDDVMVFNTCVLSIFQCLTFKIDLGMAEHLPSFYICDINENSAVPWRKKKDFVIHKSLKSILSVEYLILKKHNSSPLPFVLESHPVFYSGIISNSILCIVTWFVY